MYPNINDQQQVRFNKINETKDYFITEIHKREIMSKNCFICKKW